MKRAVLSAFYAAAIAAALSGPAGAVQLGVMLQGYLTNTTGTPYTTAQNAEFKLYQGGDAQIAGSGTLTYDETGEVTPAASGVFNYLLGSGTPATAALSTSTFDTSKALYVEISVAGSVLLPRIQLTGLPYAAIAGVAESLKPVGQVTTTVLSASSGTFAGSLTVGAGLVASSAAFTAAGPTQTSLTTSSGIVVNAGGVSAPYFSGTFYGSGAGLTGVAASNVSAPNITPGIVGSGVIVPSANLSGGPIAPALLPTTVAYTTAANTFTAPQMIAGELTASSAALTATGSAQYSLVSSSGISVGAGGVTAPFFAGSFIGSGAGLTGVAASSIPAGGVMPGTLGAGVLLPTGQLTGAAINPAILPSTVAYTSSANIFTQAQTLAAGLTATSAALTASGNTQFSLATSSGINVAAGGVTAPYFAGSFIGNGAGLTGVSATNVAAANVGAGTLGSGVLLPTGQLTGAPISPGLLPAAIGYTSSSNTWTAAQTVAAPFAIAPSGAGALETVGGVYSGPTAGYTGVGQETYRNQIVMPSWSNVAPATLGVKLLGINKTAYPTAPWYLAQTSELHVALLTHGALTTDDTQDLFQFTPAGFFASGSLNGGSASFAGGLTAASASLTGTGAGQYSLTTSSGINVQAGTVSAPAFSGAYYGDGSKLTGVGAASVAAASVMPGMLGPGVTLPAASLVNGPLSPAMLPSAVAYTSSTNIFASAQAFAGGLAASSGTFGVISAGGASLTGSGQYSLTTSSGINVAAGGVSAPFFSGTYYGDGSKLTGVGAASVPAASVTTGILSAGVLLPAVNLINGPLGASMLPPTIAYTGAANSFQAPQTFSAGLAASSATVAATLTASAAALTSTGQYSLTTASGIQVQAGVVNAPAFFGAFVGDGSRLSGVTASSVPAANVSSGLLGPGVAVSAGSLVNGPINAAVLPSTVAYTSSANTFSGPQAFTGGLTAASAAFTATGTNQFSLTTSSGIEVGAGGVTAPFFNGAFIGDGSRLSGVQIAAGNIMNGPVASAVLPSTVAYTSVANAFGPPQSFPGGLTAASGTFTSGLTAAAAALTATGQYSLAASSGINVAAGGVTAPYFAGAFVGNGAGLTGVSASNVAAANVAAGTLGSGVMLPTGQLTGAPISPSLLPAAISYTSSSNTWAAPQTIAAPFTIAPAGAGALETVGGVYSGPTAGYSGIGQETYRNQIVMPSWSNVAPNTLGVKLLGINKTAYPTAPWYLAQTSELHVALLTHGALTPDDTQDLFQFTPAGFYAAGAVTGGSASFAGALTASSASLTATGAGQYSLTTSSGIYVQAGIVSAPAFSGTYYGDGSKLTGVGAASVAAASVTPGMLGAGVTVPAASLMNGPLASAMLPATVAYTSSSNTFGLSQTFAGGLTASSGSFNAIAAGVATLTGSGQYSLTASSGISVAAGGVSAPFFSGAYYGDGSKLSGVTAASVPAAGVAPGTLSSGVLLPAANIVSGPLGAALLPSTVAYTSAANIFQLPQSFPAGLSASAANLTNISGSVASLTATGQFSLTTSSGIQVQAGVVSAPAFSGAFYGDGSRLAGVTASSVGAANVAPGVLGPGVQLAATSLINGPLSAAMLPPSVAYTGSANAFSAPQAFSGGLTAGSAAVTGGLSAASAALTANGSTQFSLTTSSGISVGAGGVSAPFFNGAFIGDGSRLSGVSAASVAAASIAAGTIGAGVQIPAGNLTSGPLSSAILPSTVAYTSAANAFGPPQSFAGGLTAASATFTSGVTAAAATLTATGQYSLAASSGINVAAGGVTAPYFTGAFVGNGAGLSGVTAASVAPANVAAGILNAGVLVPANQLTGPPVSASLLPSTVAFTSVANTWTAPQTVAAQLTVAPPSAGALEQVGGVYSGPTGGYSGIGQETSRHQIVFPSWSNVVPNTLGVKLMAINKTAYPTTPWYLAQTSELHIGVLTHGALSSDDTTDLFQFTPAGFATGAGLSANSGIFVYGLSASTLALSGTGNQYSLTASSGISVAAGGVTAPFFSGNGAGISGVTAASVAAGNVAPGTLGAGVQLPAANVSAGTLPAGVLVPAGNLTGGPIAAALLPAAVAYTGASNNFISPQGFSGGITASSATLTASGASQYSLATASGIAVSAGGVTAPFFIGAYFGNGAGLTGVTASAVAAANVSPGTLGAGVQLPAANLTSGTLGGGILVPASNLVGGPVAASLLPSTAAFTSVNNNFSVSQTINGGLTAQTGAFSATGSQASLSTSSGIVVNAGGVTAPYLSGAHIGDASRLTNIPGTSPIGSLVAFAGSAEPTGWIECDGRSLPQGGSASASWGSFNPAALFAAISTVWGSGGSGLFNIPDLRGSFPRGYNHGKTGAWSDPDAAARVAQYASGATGDAIGTYQADQIKDHTHALTYSSPWNGATSNVIPTNQANSPTNGIAAEAGSGSYQETRGKNASVMYIIRVQ